GFTIFPQEVSVFYPTVHIISTVPGKNECLFTTSDGAVYHECEFYHTWEEAGTQQIIQYVTNEFGCRADAEGKVLITGFLFYAPNSFTPDNDGINDVWLPVAAGVTEYSLTIYNRWGEAIFHTDDHKKPWIGETGEGVYFVPDGVYNYQVRLRDLEHLPHYFSGHITLVR
ncbi:MAG: gliding motility-associated C-terminal domain-containing protein, partial [Crocinitomicaceae bacterium]|nr:gliding motility-associated C-terminal domain-containing protein [Crocinitomicaceae bacterium]